MVGFALACGIVGALSALVSIPTFLILLAQFRRQTQDDHERPLRDRINEVTADRDYYRGRSDDMETRQPGRLGP